MSKKRELELSDLYQMQLKENEECRKQIEALSRELRIVRNRFRQFLGYRKHEKRGGENINE